jgi:hypothetical protein
MTNDDDLNFDAKCDVADGHMSDFMDWNGVQGAKFFKSEEGKDRLMRSIMDMQKAVQHMASTKDMDQDDVNAFSDLMEKIAQKLYKV